MTTLYVAAGGGGDAVGVLLARRVFGDEGKPPALVATCAWERLRIDPVPGPRPRSGFVRLGQIDGQAAEVLPTSDTTPGGRSVLPRLASEPQVRLFLYDLQQGAIGLRDQLRHLAQSLKADRLVVVDVGGDIVARGREPNLLSPLADSLALAAALAVGLPTTVAVVGPGVDAELSEAEVEDLLANVGASRAGCIQESDVEAIRDVLVWHPTEATTLVAASAIGVRGAALMRRGGTPTPITDRSREVWTLAKPDLTKFPLAAALAETDTLRGAEEVMRRTAVNELDFERRKAETERQVVALRPLAVVAAEGIAADATHITSRHLAEVAIASDVEAARRLDRPGGLGLWSLTDLTSLQSSAREGPE